MNEYKTIGEECGLGAMAEAVWLRQQELSRTTPPPRSHPQLAQRTADHMAMMRERRRTVNLHSEPSIVNRLIRMLEELLEREDIDASLNWYRNRLDEIKAEINAVQGSRSSEEVRAGIREEEKGELD